MTWIQRNFCWKIAYNEQKKTYVFIGNRALVPLENGNYVILHEPTK